MSKQTTLPNIEGTNTESVLNDARDELDTTVNLGKVAFSHEDIQAEMDKIYEGNTAQQVKQPVPGPSYLSVLRGDVPPPVRPNTPAIEYPFSPVISKDALPNPPNKPLA
jgi:hypothetical protein